jgi:hypothetical protein
MIWVEKDVYLLAILPDHENRIPKRMLVGQMALARLPVFSDESVQRARGSVR